MEVVIIGLGSIATKHITALRALEPDINIKALRSTKDANEVYGITNIYSLNEIGDPDFALISNPTHLHFQFIKALAQQKVPLFIEKPAVHTLDNVEELVELLKKHAIFTYVGCNLRFHPCLQFIKAYLERESAVINEVNIYCGSYLPDWRPGKNYKDIYSANLHMGGGVHLDLFHEVDYACWLFGYPNSSMGFTSNKSTLDIDAPDYAHYFLSYQGFNISIVLNYFRREPKRTLEILFDDETWTVDLIRNRIVNDDGKVIFEERDYKMADSYIAQMKYFISHLKNNSTSMNPFEQSIEVLKISLSNESIK